MNVLVLLAGCQTVPITKPTPVPAKPTTSFVNRAIGDEARFFRMCMDGPELDRYDGRVHHRSLGKWGCPDKAAMCAAYDSDQDGDVDLRDLAKLQNGER